MQSTKKRKQQRSTDKNTTSKLRHSKPLTLKKRRSKSVFFHSLYKHTNHTANFVQYLLKGGEEEVCFKLGFKRSQRRAEADFQR